MIALLLLASLMVAGAPSALAAEPPAYTPPPETAAPARPRPPMSLEGSIQEAFATMGDWHDGLQSLENRSTQSGSTITTSNNPAYTTSFEFAALYPLAPRFLAGLQFDRMTGKSEFTVRENFSAGTGPGEFETQADGTSNAWLAVVRWMIAERPGAHPYLQLGAGVGSAQLEFSTPSGGALGKGHGFAANLEAGFQVGDGPLRARAAAGWRYHRVQLGYSRIHGTSQPGVARYYFAFDDEVSAFVNGRDLDLGGAFARLGIAVAIPR